MSALRTLLAHAIDYAGLFPPAGLGMREAVAEYAGHVASDEAWALGRFVVPVARLGELEREVDAARAADGRAEPWRIAALMAADADPGPVAAFNARTAPRLLVDTVEVKGSLPDEIAAAGALVRSFVTYVEIPAERDPAPLVDAIHAVGARAKLRTGGVTADAVPTAAQVARFIAACVAEGVAFKCTAGLHHAVRGDHALTYAADAPRGTMYGYLNVFTAAALAGAGAATDDVARALEERDADAFAFDHAGLRWRDRALSAAELARARERVIMGFGSCSFREPMDEAAAFGETTS